MQVALNGCIAQLARACGSYPQCHRFKSSYSHHHGPVVKRPKTPPFHGGNTGSNPVRVTKTTPTLYGWVLFFCLQKGRDENPWGSSKQPETRVRVLGLWSLEYGKMFRVPFATVETLPTQSIPSGSPKIPFTQVDGIFTFSLFTFHSSLFTNKWEWDFWKVISNSE